jgi:APA family basic amino acid/polyamine antiporter
MTDRRDKSQPVLVRDIGPFDTTMLVMGGMVGAVIFMNPSVAAGQVHSLVLNLLARTAGGVVALIEAFIYAELANRIPEVGGQHASLREAYHSLIAFF